MSRATHLNPSTWESYLCEFSLAWSKYQVPGQLELDVRLGLKNKQKTLQKNKPNVDNKY